MLVPSYALLMREGEQMSDSYTSTAREVPLPAGSLVASAFAVTHYADAFAITLPPGVAADVDAIVRALPSAAPWWVDVLMRIRNRALRLVGLRTSRAADTAPANRAPLKPGDHAGIFTVFARTDDEILMGGDDRHLDFRASVLSRVEGERRAIVLSTVVHYNGSLGRVYFFFVRPFHRLIIPAMLWRLGRQLAEGSPA